MLLKAEKAIQLPLIRMGESLSQTSNLPIPQERRVESPIVHRMKSARETVLARGASVLRVSVCSFHWTMWIVTMGIYAQGETCVTKGSVKGLRWIVMMEMHAPTIRVSMAVRTPLWILPSVP